MSRFISAFAPSIEAMLAYREALGFSRRSYEYSLMDVDRFCAANYPHSENLTQEMVFKWIEGHAAKQAPNMREKATAIRLLGKYLAAIGKPAYILPKKYVSNSEKYPSTPCSVRFWTGLNMSAAVVFPRGITGSCAFPLFTHMPQKWNQPR